MKCNLCENPAAGECWRCRRPLCSRHAHAEHQRCAACEREHALQARSASPVIGRYAAPAAIVAVLLFVSPALALAIIAALLFIAVRARSSAALTDRRRAFLAERLPPPQ